jgi:hypothetical protein
MAQPTDYLDQVGSVVEALDSLALEPVLIGGMALVILGSRRVTRDFDFVIARPVGGLDEVLDVLYGHGLELVIRVDDAGNVLSTLANRRVASIRLRVDGPASAYFLNPRTGLRIDLLFDFPIAAATLAQRATPTKIRSHTFRVASEEDLLRLKRIAKKQRSFPEDAVDIAFLEARRAKE